LAVDVAAAAVADAEESESGENLLDLTSTGTVRCMVKEIKSPESMDQDEDEDMDLATMCD
jgi:hypothetical protein